MKTGYLREDIFGCQYLLPSSHVDEFEIDLLFIKSKEHDEVFSYEGIFTAKWEEYMVDIKKSTLITIHE